MKVIVTPLNWGLGHATRCIPIIKNLLALGHEVVIASDGIALSLLKEEFPKLKSIALPSYNINYHKKNLIWGVLFQSLKLLKSVWKEHAMLLKVCQVEGITLIISDNRLGCFNKNIYTVYLTHQINLPIESTFFRLGADWVHHFFINRYDECWIPDKASTIENLSGMLAHPVPKQIRIRVTYIGTLSRFARYYLPKKFSIIIVLSGPEPQRTCFENILVLQIKTFWSQLNEMGIDTICFVRGTNEIKNTLSLHLPGIEIHDLLPSQVLNEKILQSHFYIGRSGYTTLMDLSTLDIPAVLVPTPGQFEQEYLGQYNAKQLQLYTTEQVNFDILEAIKSLKNK